MKRRFFRNAFDRRMRRNASIILAARDMIEPFTRTTKSRNEICFVPSEQIVERTNSNLFKRGLRGWANAPDHPHWFACKKFGCFRFANDGKAVGFIQIRSNLREELVVR